MNMFNKYVNAYIQKYKDNLKQIIMNNINHATASKT